MTSSDFVIIIQGPLITSGNSGNGIEVKEMNCIDNIRNLISSSRHLVKGFVVSTWQTQISFEQESDVIVLDLEDPGPRPVIGYDSPSNEYRQTFGCLAAINKAIEHLNPKYLIKVRTDQYVDLPKMIEHILSVDSQTEVYKEIGQFGFLYFPNMLSWSPYSVGDFFIGGHTRDVKHFFEAQIELSCHTFGYDFSWLHSDIILRHAYINLRSFLNLPDVYYFPNLTPSFRLHFLHHKYPIKFHPVVIALWSILLQKSVTFFPRSISENMIWRGSKMNFEKHTMGEFFEEWDKAYPDFANWLNKLYPDLYLNKKGLNLFDKFLHFYPEKIIEFRDRRPVFRRHIYRIFRIMITLIHGRFPKEAIIPLSSVKRFFLK
jgi:hypothetical protein